MSNHQDIEELVYVNAAIQSAIEGQADPAETLLALRESAIATGDRKMAVACLLQQLHFEPTAQGRLLILERYVTETGSPLAVHVLSECHRRAGREDEAERAWKFVRWEAPVDTEENRAAARILPRLIGHPTPTAERTRSFLESSRVNSLAMNEPHRALSTLKRLIELETRESQHGRARALCEELVREESSAYSFQLLAIANEFLGCQAEALSAYEAALEHAKHEGDAARVESLTRKIATLK